MDQLPTSFTANSSSSLRPVIKRSHSSEHEQQHPRDRFRELGVGDHEDEMEYLHQKLEDPTNQIRLILLAPTLNTEELGCILQVVTLSEAHKLSFTLVSYASGDQNNRRDVSIGGLKLSITYDLYEALLNLRHPTQYLYVWANEICIDPTNLAEKSQQVFLMPNIYSLATQVFIWLGPSDDELGNLFELLTEMDADDDTTKQVISLYRMFHDATEHDQLSRAFLKLWSKLWFKGIWSALECLLASSSPIVACGSARISWGLMLGAIRLTNTLLPEGNAIRRQLYGTSSQSMAVPMTYGFGDHRSTFRNGQLNLAEAVHFTSALEATDPRDKIYAVLGLVSEDMRKKLAPDYTQSPSIIYQKAMVAMCMENMTFAPLWAAADTKPDLKLKLPSWCLDFSNTHWQERLGELHEYPLLWAGGLPRACGSIFPRRPGCFEHNASTSHLTVDGTVVGIVQRSVSMSFTSTVRKLARLEELKMRSHAANDESILSYFKNEIVARFFADINAASQLYYDILCARYGAVTAEQGLRSGEVWQSFNRGVTTEDLLGPIWRRSGLDVPKDYGNFESFRRQLIGSPVPSTWEHNLSPEHVARTSKATLERDCIIKSCLALARAIPDRTFIATHNGYQGRASMDVQAGDLLCIIFRCSRPLLLRPCGIQDHGGQLYQLVASAWVAGIMGGEFLEQSNFMQTRFTLA